MLARTTRVLTQYVFLIMLVVILNFVIVRIMPGSPLDYLSENPAAITPVMSEELKEKLVAYYGLDKPLRDQFVSYILSLFHGDLGYSIYYGEPVVTVVKPYLMRSLLLLSIGIGLTLALSLPLGLVAGCRRGSRLDSLLTTSMILLHALPPYFTAMLLLLLFSCKLGIAPSLGYVVGEESFTKLLKHTLLPATAFMVCEAGGIYYFTRNAILEVLGKDHVQLAVAKGLRERVLLLRHVFRAALPTIVSRISLLIGFSFASSMFVEYVFSYPGVMSLLTTAFNNYDYPLIHAILLLFTGVIILANLLADMVMLVVDPRTRAGVEG